MTDLIDRLHALLKQETRYRCIDYLANDSQSCLRERQDQRQEKKTVCSESHSRQQEIALDQSDNESLAPASESSSMSSDSFNETWREKICEWSYQVVDHFEFCREVVSASMNLLDRYVATLSGPIDKKTYQLAAMTTLYLAVKLSERGVLSLNSMISLSRGYFTPAQMSSTELDVLQAVSWLVHPPSPFCFARHLSYLIPSRFCDATALHDLLEHARFLTELAALDYYFVTRKASSVGLAAILNAIDATHAISYHTRLDFLDKLKLLEIPGCERQVCWTEVNKCRDRLEQLFGQHLGTPSGPPPAETPKSQRKETISPVSVTHMS